MNLKTLVNQLKVYYAQAEDAEKIIVDCALVAAGASAAGGIFPALAIPGMIVACFGAVWAMYVKICKCLNIKLGENVLKVLASAVLSNIAANLAAAFAAEILFTFVPGASIVASAVLTFCTVYLAGLMFMKMILTFAKQGKVGSDLETVSESDFENAIKKESVNKSDLKAAKEVYNKSK